MKPGDYQGYSSNTTDDAAMTAFLAKHPEEIGAKLETLRTDSCILIRRATDGRQVGKHNSDNVSGDDSGSGADTSDGARIGEVTDGR